MLETVTSLESVSIKCTRQMTPKIQKVLASKVMQRIKTDKRTQITRITKLCKMPLDLSLNRSKINLNPRLEGSNNRKKSQRKNCLKPLLRSIRRRTLQSITLRLS